MRAMDFPGRISGLALHGARLGGTQRLICTVSAAHKGGAAPAVTDALARSLKLGFLLPSLAAAHTVRMVPWGQLQPERGWGRPMLLVGLSEKSKVLWRKRLLKKQEKSPALNQLSALEAIGLGTPC